MTEGEACDIVKNTPADHGLEAWRKLSKRFDPHTGQRKRTLMSSILQPGQFKMPELSSAIEQWGDRTRTYENRVKKALDDDIKSGIIISMCPEQLQTHLNLNQSKFIDYSDVREEIMSYLETRHVNADTRGTPMDIGAFGKGDKGKGKGKGYNFGGRDNHKTHERRFQDSAGKGSGKAGTPGKTGKTGNVGKGSGKNGSFDHSRSASAHPSRPKGDPKGGGKGSFHPCKHCGKTNHPEHKCFRKKGFHEFEGTAQQPFVSQSQNFNTFLQDMQHLYQR